MREEVRMRDHNECVLCREEGRLTPADVVHHEKEIEHFPELALDARNLVCLCHTCHEAVHNKLPGQKESRERRDAMNEKFPEIW